MYYNPLLDHEFLTELMEYRQREVYARITLLTQDELPIEYIEGRVTGGSINVDGNSALRRTCNLTMILKDKSEVNQFYWTFKSKFKLEVGLKNIINDEYPDIIWFKQGVFILTTCNMNQTTNNYTITINGKDKMCLLNGDFGGNIPHSTDFGVIEEIDKNGDITYTKLLLKDIIRNAVQTYGGELPENIIINDLDDAGLELLEYRGQTEDGGDLPLYLLRNVVNGDVIQAIINPEVQICVVGENTPKQIDDKNLKYATTSELFNGNFDSESKVYLWDVDAAAPDTSNVYNIIKLLYGDLTGYRLTGLTYAGDLKSNVGETLVSVLDKIKKMLVDFEYFYNLDGKFVFQKKSTYISTPWGGLEKDRENAINETINDSHPKINLKNAQLTTAFANNPNLLNVKNDFSVWGTYKSISGADVPIHMRYAIDTKPAYYKSLSGEEYNSSTSDWREIIYQMALDYYKDANWTKDDFCQRVAAANPNTYPFGKTGYEQYYTDLQGFWRQLYDPNPDSIYEEINANDVATDGVLNGNIYVEKYHRPLSKEELFNEDNERAYSLDDLYVVSTIQIKTKEDKIVDKIVFYPFIGSKYCHLVEGQEYLYRADTGYKPTTDETILNYYPLNTICQEKDDGKKELVVDIAFKKYIEDYYSSDGPFWIKESDRKSIIELEDVCKTIYRNGIESNKEYYQYITRWGLLDNFGNLATPEAVGDEGLPQEVTDRIVYVKEWENGDYDPDTHWIKTLKESPDQLIFWFDFLETEGSDLYKYSVREIGSRTKSINDTNVKSIYYRDVPNVIFVQSLADDVYERQPGYTYIQLPPGYSSLFSISGRGKSAKERIDELLQEHSYAIEQTNITAVPLYHLEPNTRVSVQDDMSNVDGEYIVTKVTVPLTYNGTMSLSTTKVVSNIM